MNSVNADNAYRRGKIEERKRIVQIIKEQAEPSRGNSWLNDMTPRKLLDLINEQE